MQSITSPAAKKLLRLSVKHFFIVCLLFKVLPGYAQQNFINVPSTEITPRKKIFIQQQINFNELIQSNTTVDYGLGKGLEAGLNVIGLNFADRQRSFFHNDTNDTDPYNPLVLLNILKAVHISEKLSLGIGAQFGFNFDPDRKKAEAGLLYFNVRYSDLFIKQSSIVAGTYYNSLHYGGQGNRFGYWMGAEFPLSSKFHVLTESVLGSNALSYSSIGFVYYLKKRFVFTLGVQIPNTKRTLILLYLN